MRLCAIGDISTSVYFAETFLKFLTRTGIVSDRLNKYREKNWNRFVFGSVEESQTKIRFLRVKHHWSVRRFDWMILKYLGEHRCTVGNIYGN